MILEASGEAVVKGRYGNDAVVIEDLVPVQKKREMAAGVHIEVDLPVPAGCPEVGIEGELEEGDGTEIELLVESGRVFPVVVQAEDIALDGRAVRRNGSFLHGCPVPFFGFVEDTETGIEVFFLAFKPAVAGVGAKEEAVFHAEGAVPLVLDKFFGTELSGIVIAEAQVDHAFVLDGFLSIEHEVVPGLEDEHIIIAEQPFDLGFQVEVDEPVFLFIGREVEIGVHHPAAVQRIAAVFAVEVEDLGLEVASDAIEQYDQDDCLSEEVHEGKYGCSNSKPEIELSL